MSTQTPPLPTEDLGSEADSTSASDLPTPPDSNGDGGLEECGSGFLLVTKPDHGTDPDARDAVAAEKKHPIVATTNDGSIVEISQAARSRLLLASLRDVVRSLLVLVAILVVTVVICKVDNWRCSRYAHADNENMLYPPYDDRIIHAHRLDPPGELAADVAFANRLPVHVNVEAYRDSSEICYWVKGQEEWGISDPLAEVGLGLDHWGGWEQIENNDGLGLDYWEDWEQIENNDGMELAGDDSDFEEKNTWSLACCTENDEIGFASGCRWVR